MDFQVLLVLVSGRAPVSYNLALGCYPPGTITYPLLGSSTGIFEDDDFSELPDWWDMRSFPGGQYP